MADPFRPPDGRSYLLDTDGQTVLAIDGVAVDEKGAARAKALHYDVAPAPRPEKAPSKTKTGTEGGEG